LLPPASYAPPSNVALNTSLDGGEIFYTQIAIGVLEVHSGGRMPPTGGEAAAICRLRNPVIEQLCIQFQYTVSCIRRSKYHYGQCNHDHRYPVFRGSFRIGDRGKDIMEYSSVVIRIKTYTE